MKFRAMMVWAAAVVAVGAGGVRGDGFRYRGSEYTDVKIKDIKDGELVVSVEGKDQYFRLREVSQVTMTGQREFSDAEKNRGNVAVVGKLIEKIGDPAVKRVAEARAMGMGLDYGATAKAFLDIYANDTTAGTWELHPGFLPRDAGMKEGKAVAALLEAAVAAGPLKENAGARRNVLEWLADTYSKCGDAAGAARAKKELAGLPRTGGGYGMPRPAGVKVEGARAAAGSRVSFFGLPADEKTTRVVFVLDHSGSLIDTFDFLAGVKESVGKMSDKERFAVVMFSEQVDAVFPKEGTEPVAATKDVQRDLMNFVDNVRATGGNDDLLDPFVAAFQKASAFRPEVVYFLTDGNFDPALEDRIKKINEGGKMKIHTIGFVRVTREAEEMLKRIADESGGGYRFIGERDLGG